MKNLALLAMLAALPNSPAKAGPNLQPPELQTRLQQRLDEIREEGHFPGATVGVALPDGRVLAAATGWADAGRHVPVKPSDRMLAGSTGKTFASALILQLAQDKKIGLDDKIEKWLGLEPWFPRLPNAHLLTLRQLMTHSSGIPEHVLDPKFIAELKRDPYRTWKPAELLAFVLDQKPLFEPGKGFSYADTNYIIAGMIFEKVSGRNLYAEMRRRILNPFKLDDTVPSDQPEIPRLIAGFLNPQMLFGWEGPTVHAGRLNLNPQFEWTGGGVASTSRDLARWAKLLYEAKVFGKAELQEMLTTVDAGGGRGGGKDARYGLAVQTRPTSFGMSYGHDGWFPGYLTAMTYFPDSKTAVAIQINSDPGLGLKKSPDSCVEELARVVIH